MILNYSRNPQRRFEFDLGIDANDNPVDGMDVGLAAMNALTFVLDNPKATAVIPDVGNSNVVLRFHGWEDQTRTDFLKGRSLSIQAAKTALEGSGFALPEPIYRLRFDKPGPLPMQSLQSSPVCPSKKPKAPTVPDVASDTAPDSHMETLVAEERASGSQDDLLSDRRPIE